jgi:hypothetical protein
MEIAQYPKEVVDYASKKLTSKMLSNEIPSSPFRYFIAVCKNYTERAAQQPQKQDGGKSSNREKSIPADKMALMKKEQEEKYKLFMQLREEKRRLRLIELGYNPSKMSHFDKVQILNKDKLTYFTNEDTKNPNFVGAAEIIEETFVQKTIMNQETPYEFALNYEKLIHARTLEDPIFAKKCAKFDKNPVVTKLSTTEWQEIWRLAHGDSCECRRHEDAGIILPDIAKNITLEIV